MYYNDLNGMKVSALGYGILHLPTIPGDEDTIDRPKAREIVDYAIANGVNLFDTSHAYLKKDSERFLGEVIQDYPREKLHISTKFSVKRNPDLPAVFEEQLERLHTDYVDIYMLHGVDENSIDLYMDPERDYIGYLREQKAKGRIRNLGFSAHMAPETLKRFLEWYSDFDVALIQLNYLDWTLLQAKEQYEIITSYNIPIMVMEPLKGGRIAHLSDECEGMLKDVLPDRTIASWSFRFLQSLPNVKVVLSGMSYLEHAKENLSTFGDARDPLSGTEIEKLLNVADIYKKDLGIPCSACRYCVPDCPMQLNIPVLIRGYNEGQLSGHTWHVAELDSIDGPENCIKCGTCLKHCPQKINIPEVLEKFAKFRAEKEVKYEVIPDKK